MKKNDTTIRLNTSGINSRKLSAWSISNSPQSMKIINLRKSKSIVKSVSSNQLKRTFTQTAEQIFKEQ